MHDTRPGVLLRFWACKEILSDLISNESKVILDVGGYDGFLLSNMKNENVMGIVLDTDEGGLKKAKEQGLNTILGSALEIPCMSNSVDIVLALDIMEHIQDDGDALEEMYRVLKNDGVLILTTPIKNKKLVPFMPKESMRKLHHNWGHIREGYSREELNFLLSKKSFQIIKTETYFNAFDRLIYSILFCLPLPFYSIKIKIFDCFLKTEPKYKKFGFEHLILAKAIKSQSVIHSSLHQPLQETESVAHVLPDQYDWS